MPDLTPVDLKDGYRLVFQKSKESVRAVIKRPDGELLCIGPVVPEAEFMRSSRVVMTSKEWLDILNPPVLMGGVDGFASGFDEDEIEDDEDDLEDEY